MTSILHKRRARLRRLTSLLEIIVAGQDSNPGLSASYPFCSWLPYHLDGLAPIMPSVSLEDRKLGEV